MPILAPFRKHPSSKGTILVVNGGELKT